MCHFSALVNLTVNKTRKQRGGCSNAVSCATNNVLLDASRIFCPFGQLNVYFIVSKSKSWSFCTSCFIRRVGSSSLSCWVDVCLMLISGLWR